MKVGEKWRLKKHHETALYNAAKKANVEPYFINVEIVRLMEDLVVIIDEDEDERDLYISGLTWQRGPFVEAYMKVRS